MLIKIITPPNSLSPFFKFFFFRTLLIIQLPLNSYKMNSENTTEIKPYSPAELARLYGVSRWTIKNWLKPHISAIGSRVGRYYTTKQVKTIFEKLGLPFEKLSE